MMLFLMLFFTAQCSSFVGQLAYEYASHAAAVRHHIFSRNPGGESLQVVPPSSNRTDEYLIRGEQQVYSRAGTLVHVQLRIFKVIDVDPARGELSLKVWFRLQWQDDRLAWDPSDFGNVSQVHMRAADSGPGANTEIWVPDIVVFNSGPGASFEPAVSVVESDGTVFWSRPGVLAVLCAFSGLNNFPYDTLRCPIDFGGWLVAPAQQGIALMDGGVEIASREGDPTERSTITTYSEWQLLDATASIAFYSYPSSPNVPWPVVSALVTLRRDANLFYMSVLLLPPIFLAVLAVSTFFMTPGGGRLGFGITVLLSSQFGKAVVMALMPICSEFLWIDLYIMFHESFTFATLVMLIVSHFFYVRSLS